MKFELDERFTEISSEEMIVVEGGKLKYKFKSKFGKILTGVLGLHPLIWLYEHGFYITIK